MRVALLGYPALVTVVIMASGNHFLVDALGGFVVVGLALVSLRGVSALLSRWSGRVGPDALSP